MTALGRGRKPCVCLVTQWYPPEPAFVAHGIAQSLRELGWNVEVLTAHPNYPTGILYPGHGPAWQTKREVIDGVEVTRTPIFPSHDASAGRRVLNYLSWALSASVFGYSALRRADVALVYASPATAALPATIAHHLSGTPMVLMVQDLWPDSVTSSGLLASRHARLVGRILEWAMKELYASASHVIAISPGMLELLRSRGVAKDRSSLVFNWASEHSSSSVARTRSLRADLGLADDDFLLMYAGNHGPAQGLGLLVDAVQGLNPELQCHLVMIGGGLSKNDLMDRSRADLRRVHFLPSVPQEELFHLMGQADVQCVSLSKEKVFEITVPSKLQNILAAGLPVLTVADGDAADITRRSGGGIAVNAGDLRALKSAVEQLASNRDSLVTMGRASRDFYEGEMSRSVGAGRLAAILKAVVVSRGGASRRIAFSDTSERTT